MGEILDGIKIEANQNAKARLAEAQNRAARIQADLDLANADILYWTSAVTEIGTGFKSTIDAFNARVALEVGESIAK